MDVRIELYTDDEGLYSAGVTLEDGRVLIVDPRNVFVTDASDGITRTYPQAGTDW